MDRKVVGVSGYLSVYLSIHVSFYLCTSLSISLAICLSISLSIYLFMCRPIHLSNYLSICLFVHLSIHLSIYFSVYLSVYPVKQNHLSKPEDLMLQNARLLRNQRPDLLTSLMNMSLVLPLPRDVPRLPSFLQTPHVSLTFDNVQNPLRLPRKTAS